MLEIHLKVNTQLLRFILKNSKQISQTAYCKYVLFVLQAATFTPAGLRTMGSIHPGVDMCDDIVTFCTYSFLDFEVHSTPLVSGSQPNYGFTSRYALTAHDLGRLGGQGSKVRVEFHQALGGVRFVTHGNGQIPLIGAMERRGERIGGCVSITGTEFDVSPGHNVEVLFTTGLKNSGISCLANGVSVSLQGPEGEIVGVVDFWVRLFPPAEPIHTVIERPADRRTVTQRRHMQTFYDWQDSHEVQ